jgi:hypothetical protein
MCRRRGQIGSYIYTESFANPKKRKDKVCVKKRRDGLQKKYQNFLAYASVLGPMFHHQQRRREGGVGQKKGAHGGGVLREEEGVGTPCTIIVVCRQMLSRAWKEQQPPGP